MSNDDTPARAMTLSQPHADLPSENEWNLMQRMCKAFAESELYPNIKNVAQAIAIVQTGRELGIPPSTALREFSIIGGKPAASAGILAGLCQRDHGNLALRVTEYTDDHCTVEFRRRGWPAASTVTFTMADAKKAGLLDPQKTKYGTREPNPNWEKFPRSMLRSRAISEAARTGFQDSILGLYTPEELAPDLVTVTEDGEVVLDAAVIDVVPESTAARPAPTAPAEPEATAAPAPDPVPDKRRTAVLIQEHCQRVGRVVPQKTGQWIALSTELGMPAISKQDQMTAEWFDQVLARLRRADEAAATPAEPIEGELVEADDDAPVGHSAEFVRVRDAIAAATNGADVARLYDEDLNVNALGDGEYGALGTIADARTNALEPQPVGAVS